MQRSEQKERHTSHKNIIPGLRLFTHSLQGIADISNVKPKNQTVTDPVESPRMPLSSDIEDKMSKPKSARSVASSLGELPPRFRKVGQNHKKTFKNVSDYNNSSGDALHKSIHDNIRVTAPQMSAAHTSGERCRSNEKYRGSSSANMQMGSGTTRVYDGTYKDTDRWASTKRYSANATPSGQRGDRVSTSGHEYRNLPKSTCMDNSAHMVGGISNFRSHFKTRDRAAPNIHRGGRVSPGAQRCDSAAPTRYGHISPGSCSDITLQSSGNKWICKECVNSEKSGSSDTQLDSGYCEKEDWSDELFDVEDMRLATGDVLLDSNWSETCVSKPSELEYNSRIRSVDLDSDNMFTESVKEKLQPVLIQNSSSFKASGSNAYSRNDDSERNPSSAKNLYFRGNWNSSHYKSSVAGVSKKALQSVTQFVEEEDWETEIMAVTSGEDARLSLPNDKLDSITVIPDSSSCMLIQGDNSVSECNNINKEVIKNEILPSCYKERSVAKIHCEEDWIIPRDDGCIPMNYESCTEGDKTQSSIGLKSTEQEVRKRTENEIIVRSGHSQGKKSENELEKALWECRITNSDQIENEQNKLNLTLQKDVEKHEHHIGSLSCIKDGKTAHLFEKENNAPGQNFKAEVSVPHVSDFVLADMKMTGENEHFQISDLRCDDVKNAWIAEKLEYFEKNSNTYKNKEGNIHSSENFSSKVIAGLEAQNSNSKTTICSDSFSVHEFLPIENSSEIGDFHLGNMNIDDSTHWETASENEHSSIDIANHVKMSEIVGVGFHENENIPTIVSTCIEPEEDSKERNDCASSVSCSSQRCFATEELDDVMDNICAMENEQLLEKHNRGENELDWSVQTCPSNSKNFEIDYMYSDSGCVKSETDMRNSDNSHDQDRQTKINAFSKSEKYGKKGDKSEENGEDVDFDGYPHTGYEQFDSISCIGRNIGGREAYERTVDRKLSSLLAQRRTIVSPRCRKGVARGRTRTGALFPPNHQVSEMPVSMTSTKQELDQPRKNLCSFQKMKNLASGGSCLPVSEESVAVLPSSMYLQYLDAYGQFKVSNYLQERSEESVEDWKKLMDTDTSMEQQAKMFYASQPAHRKRHSSAGSPGLVSSTLGIPSVECAKELIEDHNRISGIGRGSMAWKRSAIGCAAATNISNNCKVNSVDITVGDVENNLKPFTNFRPNQGFLKTSKINSQTRSESHPTEIIKSFGHNFNDMLSENNCTDNRTEYASTDRPFHSSKYTTTFESISDRNRRRLASEQSSLKEVESNQTYWKDGAQGRRKSDTECYRPTGNKYVIPQKRTESSSVTDASQPEGIRKEFMRKVHARCQSGNVSPAVQVASYNHQSSELFPERPLSLDDEYGIIDCNREIESFLNSDRTSGKQHSSKNMCVGSFNRQTSNEYRNTCTTEMAARNSVSGGRQIMCSCAPGDVHMWLWRSCTCSVGKQPKLCEVRPMSAIIESPGKINGVDSNSFAQKTSRSSGLQRYEDFSEKITVFCSYEEL